MALLEIPRDPSPRTMRWFGLLLGGFLAVIGLLLDARFGLRTAPTVLYALALLVALAYYLVPSLRSGIYRAWILLVYPIGWTISHLLLASVYYLVLTPIGLLGRLLGRDPMQRRFDPGAATYWAPWRGSTETRRYFRPY
jgi:hypothetical protein